MTISPHWVQRRKEKRSPWYFSAVHSASCWVNLTLGPSKRRELILTGLRYGRPDWTTTFSFAPFNQTWYQLQPSVRSHRSIVENQQPVKFCGLRVHKKISLLLMQIIIQMSLECIYWRCIHHCLCQTVPTIDNTRREEVQSGISATVRLISTCVHGRPLSRGRLWLLVWRCWKALAVSSTTR